MMPARPGIFEQGGYYHIYNRGTGKERIFFSEENYEHCLRLVRRYDARYGITVIAYCLMPNHYHFLLRQDSDVPVGRFIDIVFNAYSQAINCERNRTGTLFEGRFKHVLIDDDGALVHVCRYIHLNPVNALLVKQPEDWPYSDYRGWVGQGQRSAGDEALIRAFFQTPEDYREFVGQYQTEVDTQSRVARYVWD